MILLLCPFLMTFCRIICVTSCTASSCRLHCRLHRMCHRARGMTQGDAIGVNFPVEFPAELMYKVLAASLGPSPGENLYRGFSTLEKPYPLCSFTFSLLDPIVLSVVAIFYCSIKKCTCVSTASMLKNNICWTCFLL